MKIQLLILLATCLATAPALALQTPDKRDTVVPRAEPEAAELSERVAALWRTSKGLRAASRQLVREPLSPADEAQLRDYNGWLEFSARRVDVLALKGESALKADARPRDRTSFDLQYLQLQSDMQQEHRRFTALSNIMRTKHDTAKNSISNIR